ncbi:MAG TPA: DsrE family protein [Thermodesulfobacteriota bacterium]|nr:DsrE family protein [Thermodesulfobacteriota bacterium]
MMKRKIILLFNLFIAISLLCAVPTVSGEEYRSMKDIKSAKVVFDLRIGNPKSAALLLKVIHQTYKELAAMELNPVSVVVFLGPSVKLISRNREGFSPEDQKSLDEIADTISAMSKDGINLEVCLMAAKVFNVNPSSVLPEFKTVGNGWISMIAYQSHGYSLVPVY